MIMVEKIVVAPNEVRGYGNIVDNDKDKSDLCFYNSFVNADTDLIDGIRIGIMRMIYQDPNLFFSFHQLEKYLYVNSDDMTLSFDSNNKRLVFDDTTESFSLGFDSTNKVLYIGETGEHNYSIAFSQSSYTASGGSATLEITLLDSNVPVQSASVTVTGSDSSSYTGITNSNGIASVTVSNISSETTFTATYQNVTAVCTVSVLNYLINDDATSDNSSSLFGSSVPLRNSGSNTVSWDNGNYYLVTNSSSQKESMRVLSPLTGVTDDFVFEYDSYVEQVGGSSGFVIYNSSTAWEKLTDDADSSKKYWYGYNNGSFHETAFYGNQTTYQKWVHYKYTIQGTTFTMEVTYNGDTIVTRTETIHFNRNSTTQYGLDSEWNSNTKTRYKNLQAYLI